MNGPRVRVALRQTLGCRFVDLRRARFRCRVHD
jgi:hypothetical protein